MHIHLLQTDIRWHDTEGNIAAAERLIETAATNPGDDAPTLFVLPEMWASGFDTAPRPMQETAGSHRAALAWMQRTARTHRAYVAGSIATCGEGGLRFNRLYFVRPDASFATYDKRHLFGYGGEPEAFAAGQERVVVDCGPWRILLQICYDLRFPVFARNRNDYDLMVYVANWPDSRRLAWDTLLRARAIENQCFVCGVNRTGSDPRCTYSGGSALIDAYGRTVADAGAAETLVSAHIGLDGLRRFREKFPVLRDADRFHLET